MPAHDEILQAALRICAGRRGWRFRPIEIVHALPHLDPGTIRTHVISRCCVNAPKNHPHKWDYFERVARGQYEIRRSYRRRRSARAQTTVAEPPGTYGRPATANLRDTIHSVVSRSGAWYVAECLEAAIVTQGRTLDELVANLHEAVQLHLTGEDAGATGLVPFPRISVTYETSSRPDA